MMHRVARVASSLAALGEAVVLFAPAVVLLVIERIVSRSRLLALSR